MYKKIINKILLYVPLPQFVKKLLLKKLGKIGKNFYLGSRSIIYADKLLIGDDVYIGKNTVIKTMSLKLGNGVSILHDNNIIATQLVEIGDDSKINEKNIIGGGQRPESLIKIGCNVHIYPFCFLNTTMPLIIEDGVGIGGGTYIFTHGSWQSAYNGFPYTFAPVTIKKNAWLPWRVFVMPGITIGEDATIGSDALITKNIPDKSFAVGVPAKVLKSGNEYIKVMDFIEKFNLMKIIFEDFKKNYEFFNKESLNLIIEEGQFIEINFTDRFKILYNLKDQVSKENQLLLTELSENTNLMEGMFDLKNNLCKKSNNSKINEFYSFITNYGIRLQIIR
jgi:acetyltransferase-like isoleucine patch superfamily enzyme